MYLRFLITLLVMFGVGCSQETEWEDSTRVFVRDITDQELAEAPPEFRHWVEGQRSGVCHVHDIKMDMTSVPIVYGLDKITLPTMEEQAAFPFGQEFYLGGCVVTPRTTDEVYTCPECVNARRRWATSKGITEQIGRGNE